MLSAARILEILYRAGMLDHLQRREVQVRHTQVAGSICRVITDLGFCTEEAITEAIAAELSVARAHLNNRAPDPAALALIPQDLAHERGIYPVALHEDRGELVLAMTDPTDAGLRDEAAQMSGLKIQALLAGELEIERAISRGYRGVVAAPASSPGAALPADAVQRVASVYANQDKAGRILEALLELLQEKGVLTAGQIQQLRGPRH